MNKSLVIPPKNGGVHPEGFTSESPSPVKKSVKKMTVLIREATLADRDSIEEIERVVFGDPWDLSTLLVFLHFHAEMCFIAIDSGKKIGYAIGLIEERDGHREGHICNLAVRPDYQSRRVGTKLIKRLEAQFAWRAADLATLEVRLSNKSAQRFYLRLGYRHVRVIKRYYKNGEDAIVMRRLLKREKA